MGGPRTAHARARVTSGLEAVGLFRLAEIATAPIRVPVGRRNLRRFYAEFVTAGDLIFDIGANVGEHTAVLLSLGAHVVSVEPQATCAERLRERFGASATVVEAAVAATAGPRSMYLNTISDERATLSSEHVEHGRFARGWEGVASVEALTLDDLIAEHGQPAVCKIDVEALEPEVLRGLNTPLALVIFEYHEGFAGTRECLELLDALGPYEFNFRVGRTPSLASATWGSSAEIYARLEAVGIPIYGDVVARLTALRA